MVATLALCDESTPMQALCLLNYECKWSKLMATLYPVHMNKSKLKEANEGLGPLKLGLWVGVWIGGGGGGAAAEEGTGVGVNIGITISLGLTEGSRIELKKFKQLWDQ